MRQFIYIGISLLYILPLYAQPLTLQMAVEQALSYNRTQLYANEQLFRNELR